MKRIAYIIIVISLFAVVLNAQASRTDIYIGNPNSSWWTSYGPANFDSRHSLAQNIYLQNDIGVYGGTISSVTYSVNTLRGINPDQLVKIYMASTPKTEFSSASDWLPFNEFTLVYEGYLPIDTDGVYDITLPLDTSYLHNSGSLVVMTNKIGTYFDPYAIWWHLTNTGSPQTLIAYSNESSFSPQTAFPVINETTVYGGRLNGYPNISLNITGGTYIQYNLEVVAFTGETFTVVGQEANYTISVKNQGFATVNDADYTIKLFAGENELTAVQGVTISPASNEDITIAWTPSNAGKYTLHALIDYAEDEIPANNTTEGLLIYVASATDLISYVGDESSDLITDGVPVYNYFETSISQTIYLENEIGAAGYINALVYDFVGYGFLPAGLTVSVQFATISSNSYPNDTWVPFSQFQEVYNGPLPVNVSDRKDLVLPLDTPYLYTGGNLVVMVYKHYNYYWGPGDFFVTLRPDEVRVLIHASMENDLDWTNMPVSLTGDFIPNTRFVINTQNTGILYGNVTTNSQPLEGVKIAINTKNRTTLSDSEGNYNIPYILQGNIGITASKHGYLDNTINNITINANQNTQQNITMSLWETVTVTGTVLASDTNAGLLNADIYLTGYEDYHATTNAQGQFTIEGVYINLSYYLTIRKRGYETHENPAVNVNNTALQLQAITLNEIAFSPRRVKALPSSSQLALSWEAPTDEQWFSHSIALESAGAVNTGIDSDLIIAHRYSPQQLQDWGVAGALLGKVSYLPVNRNYDHFLMIWKATSGETFTPGELLHEEYVPSYILQNNQWSEIALTEPVLIPESEWLWIGVRINSTNSITLAYDNGAVIESYGNLVRAGGEWFTLSQLTDGMVRANWLIKAMAELSLTRNTRTLTGYSIYRAGTNALHNQSTWTHIANVPFSQTTYNDSTWSQVGTGAYKYIVQAVFSNENISNPAFSNTVDVGLSAQVYLSIYTENNTDPTGAVVRLVNNNGNPEYSYFMTAIGNDVTFPTVWRGNYTLRVSLSGFVTHIDYNLSVQVNPFSHDVSLYEKQTIFHEDFENEFPPSGWTLIDADSDGLNWLQFFREGGVTPNSGFACIGSESWDPFLERPLTPDNYIITPQINLPTNNSLLEYYIATYDMQYYAEKYSVMVSTSTPEIANFVTVFTETLTPQNVNWQPRNIYLNNYAGLPVYIAFRHHNSTNNDLICLDDISLYSHNGPMNETANVALPPKNYLKANYPNPFNPSTTIAFDIETAGNVRIDVFNIKGQKVKSLANNFYQAGNHKIVWNGTDDKGQKVSSGIYLYRMVTENYSSTRKMLLLK